MKIINYTDTEIVITRLNTISSATSSIMIPAGTFAYVDEQFDTLVISCRDGHIDVFKTQDTDDRFHLYPYDNLDATYKFDLDANDFVVRVFRVKGSDKCSNSWFEQHDKTLHDKSIRDNSTHLTSAHTAAYKRIDELTDAIKKSIQMCVPNETTSDVKQIRNWAKEIMLQCGIIDSIDED